MERMNNDEKAINFYVNEVFEFNAKSRLSFKDEIFDYFKFFMDTKERLLYAQCSPENYHKTTGYIRIMDIFTRLVKTAYGEKALCVGTKRQSVYFKLSSVYKEDENDYVVAWKSPTFRTYLGFQKHAIGFGKLAFHRATWPELLPNLPGFEFFHTGLTMARQDESTDLVEVAKMKDEFKIRMRKVTEAIAEQNHNKMFIDNQSLHHRHAVDTKKTLFRVSRVLNKTLSYDVFRLNCDHLSTWLLTGLICWTTAAYELYLPVPGPQCQGEVDESVLQAIEGQLSESFQATEICQRCDK